MKRISIIIMLLFAFSVSEARHITGGEVIYDYVGPGTTPGSSIYRITLRLFRDEHCQNCADMPVSVSMGIFNNDNNQIMGGYINIALTSSELIPINALPLCITDPPELHYRVGYYTTQIQLPANTLGYTATYQTCCRIDGIRNVPNSEGATYVGRIPAAVNDNSPRFSLGISVVCYNKPFTLDFSATDPDGDSLVYSLCDAYDGGAAADASYSTPSPPPYASINYINGYSGSVPMGPQAQINRNTGIISGIAPPEGKYVVSVCVSSFRNGSFIGQHRKDFIITVAACDFAGAQLLPDYLSCDGFTFTFSNLNTSPLNQTFTWHFDDPGSGANNISTLASPTHTFSDTGIYQVKLVVNEGNGCADSTTSSVKVYPGFFPAFSSNAPTCKGVPVQFRDESRATYGTINFWRWSFGDPDSSGDTSRIQHPTYIYNFTGNYQASLIVASNKGCRDTIYSPVEILEKPVFNLTNDTLICYVDTLKLIATAGSPGSVTWTPNYSISDIHSFNPLVSPDLSTTYVVSYSDNFGCSTIDSVRVNVIDRVNIETGVDTTICLTDPILLQLNSNALYHEWTPPLTLNDPTLQQPVALPTEPLTTYHVIGKVSDKCFDEDEIKIRTVPYPIAAAGLDTSICIGTSAFLHASGGTNYSWSPTRYLNDPNSPDPVVVTPATSVLYIVSVSDNRGCPKPVKDSVLVRVVQILANAGPRDTAIVIGQPLLLNATGGDFYLWTPDTWLSSTVIPNPISNPEDDIIYIVRVNDVAGCFAFDTINVKLYDLDAGLYIPTAFSPNGDGLNDIFKPLALGLQTVDVFRIYNRWGQMIYYTTQIGQGWDGKYRGNEQAPGTYVWYAEGTDFRNKKLQKKGYVVLIR